MVTALLFLVVAAAGAAGPASAPAPASRPPSSAAARPLPSGWDRARLERLLQAFVDSKQGAAFRFLGDNRDFDHGHFLFRAGSPEPVAVLYHTQEHRQSHPNEFWRLDPAGRNWLQWLDGTGRIEDARPYVRSGYPDTPSWRWFKTIELPGLERHRTVSPAMLDPERFGGELGDALQWEFTRVPCAEGGALRVELRPGPVCLDSNL